MANWIGSARTNYFHVIDMETLTKMLAPFPFVVQPYSEDATLYCLLVREDDEYGGWPDWEQNEEGQEVQFSFEETVMPFVKEGEVVVAMEIGAEKLNYLTGWAGAFIRRGDKVDRVHFNLRDIYDMAARAFKVPADNIEACEY